MCGIVGLFAKSPEVEERLGEHLAAMLVQMSSRGPDSAGVAVYRNPAPSGSSKLTLYSANPREQWGAAMDGLEHRASAFLVEPGDSQGLAEGISFMLTTDTREMVARARRSAEELFSIETMWRKHVQLYSACLQRA